MTKFYRIDEIPETLKVYMDKDFDTLSDLLLLERYILEPVPEDYEPSIAQQKLTGLGITKPVDQLIALWCIRSEQLEYIYKWNYRGDFPNCCIPLHHRWDNDLVTSQEWWLCVSYYDDQPLGAIYLFRDIRRPDKATIQGIGKFLTPFLTDHSPSLNRSLIPSVIDFARTLGVKEIYVAPVGVQGNLLNNYGFVPIESMYFASPYIRESNWGIKRKAYCVKLSD
jgi:hypothetical protein